MTGRGSARTSLPWCRREQTSRRNLPSNWSSGRGNGTILLRKVRLLTAHSRRLVEERSECRVEVHHKDKFLCVAVQLSDYCKLKWAGVRCWLAPVTPLSAPTQTVRSPPGGAAKFPHTGRCWHLHLQDRSTGRQRPPGRPSSTRPTEGASSTSEWKTILWTTWSSPSRTGRRTIITSSWCR